MEVEEKVNSIISSLKPFLAICSGDITIVSINNKIITLKIIGACAACKTSKELLITNIVKAFNEQLGIEYIITVK